VLRNRGVGVAEAPLLAFTDDDCRPAPDWLERLVERAAHADGDFILQGRTEPDPDERQRLYGLARSQSIVGPSPWFEACNILYPRELFERLGGFDERFDGGGEDADLGLRAVAAGARPVYVDEARVWHAVHSRHVWQAVREEGRWHTIPLVLASHPRQREALELGIFWKAGHPRVLLAAAGLVAAARGRGIGLAATLPYMHQHVRSYSKTPRGMLRAALDAPARALVDLAGVAVTVRSAIRHRAAII
jgi:GT2 family glycosyltransferase